MKQNKLMIVNYKGRSEIWHGNMTIIWEFGKVINGRDCCLSKFVYIFFMFHFHLVKSQKILHCLFIKLKMYMYHAYLNNHSHLQTNRSVSSGQSNVQD